MADPLRNTPDHWKVYDTTNPDHVKEILDLLAEGDVSDIDIDIDISDDEDHLENIPGAVSTVPRLGSEKMSAKDDLLVTQLECTEDAVEVASVDNDLEGVEEPHELSVVTETVRNSKPEYEYLTRKEEIKYRRHPWVPPPIHFEDQCNIDQAIVEEPVYYFMKYITEQEWEMFSRNTNIYALQSGYTNFKPTNPDEIKALIGLHIAIGNLKFPRVRLYWDKFVGIGLFLNSMSRDRFFQLRNALHIVNNLERPANSSDKLYKVCPLYNAIRKRCLQLSLEQSLCIDEQMVPFKGQLSIKQYVKGKPCPWGIKIFVLAGRSGVAYDFLKGSTTELDEQNKKLFGLGASVVLHLCDRIKSEGHKLYFDNYFSSYHVFQVLNQRKIFAAGTVRVNRFCSPSLINDSDIKKKERGFSDQVVSRDNNIVLTKWLDNRTVVLGSNFVGIGKEDTVERWDKTSRSYVKIRRPEVVKLYNEGMGGVDLFDQLIGLYRIFIRSRKWTLRMLMHGVDFALVNSWLEYRKHCSVTQIQDNKVLDLLHFRMSVAESLVKSGTNTKRKRGRPTSEEAEKVTQQKRSRAERRPLSSVQYDGINHLPVVDQRKDGGRCNTNLLSCKLTHTGKDYTGIKATTASGRRCQFWDTSYPVHKIARNISDEDFPEGSRKDARNYCRNPTNASRGPWCYTLDSDVPYEECDIPLCASEDCKLSGLGIDYAGNVKKPFSGDSGKCSKWTDRELFPEGRFADRLFPERSRSSAGRYCRNPDGNPRGPWCPVDPGDGSPAVRAPCEIPFCKDADWLEYTEAETNEFTHFIDLFPPNKTLSSKTLNVTFGIRLWDAASWSEASAKILLSPFSIPGTAQTLSKVGAVEVTITKNNSGFTEGLEEVELWLIKGTPFRSEIAGSDWPWLQLWVEQNDNVLALGQQGSEEPLSSGQMSDLSVDLGLRYISLSGSGIVWTLPFKLEDCPQHITSELHFTRFFRMQQTPGGHDVTWHLRARHSVGLELRIAPSVKYPSFRIIIQNKVDNMTTIILREEVGGKLQETPLQRKNTSSTLSYHHWHDFTLSLFGEKLQLFWVRSWDTKMLVEIEHELIKQIQWFSPSSNNSVAHWVFRCHPQDPPSALPPDCVASSSGSASYGGGQYSASSGEPCLFWPTVPGAELGPDARNLCRNPGSSKEGPWCYVGKTGTTDYKKKTCDVPVCLSVECRLAGTGNDFIGPLNVTRSGRHCQPWLDNEPHKVNQTYLNDTLFAERSLKEARNYCRDPSRNIGGPWCYTMDPKLPRDLCHAYDCVMPGMKQ